MRHSAMWVWLFAAAVLAAGQRPGLSVEVQNLHPAEAEATVAQAGATEDRKAEADALFQQGVHQVEQSQFRDALQSWEAALALYQDIEDIQGQADALTGLGFIHLSLSDNREAIAYYEQALPLFQALEDLQGQVSVLTNLGFAHWSLSDYRGAIAYYEQALPLFQTIENHEGPASVVLMNLGAAYQSLSDYRKAIAYYEQALPVFQALEDLQGQASVLMNLGVAYQSLSDYWKAIAYYEQALPLFQALENRYGQANVLTNLGIAYRSLSDYRGAIAYYEQALPLYQAIEDQRGQAKVLNNLGNTYGSLNDYRGAIAYYERALPLFQSLEDRQGQAKVLANLGIAYGALSDHRGAIDYLEQALPLYQAIEDRQGQANALTGVGLAYWFLSDHRGAIAYYEQALPLYQAIEDRSGQSALLRYFGALLAAQEQPELAIAFYKASVNLRESIRADLQELPEDLQSSYTESISESYRELVRLLLEQDRVLEAQQVLELLRVQEIDEYLRDMRGNAQTAEGLDLWEAEQQLLAIYMEMVEAGQGFDAFLNRPEVQAFTQQLQRNARGQNLNPETLVRLQNDLKQLDNAVLLYPLILGDRLELVLVTPEGLTRETVAIDRVQLNQLIATFRTDITGRKPEVEQSAQQLYDLLIRPLAPYLGETQTILYAADGQLRYFPLAALHDGEQWLAQRFNVNLITAASLTDWGRSQSADLSVLAGAFSEGNHQVKVGDKLLDYNGLPHAGIEVERIATDIPATKAYFNQDFSRVAVESQLENHSIVHFATHAEFVVGSPHESFILFGNGDRVNLQEIANWSLPGVDLVVLSACQTAVSGELGQGEEILGFGYQIQRTGARAAIASLWYVNDGSTQVLMNAFYTALQNGYSPTEALRRAQQALIEGDLALLGEDIRADFELITAGSEPSNSTLNHPYYWAPFILIGNGL
ncbi:tetratricopeptide repeat protein [Nodosilinea sp. LEGE 07298]|uniref:CHAT domain-containing protein n=1 Tax=Nodosilinea sp. LEGE 07298 TaxID=2777970 RepID=UPI0018827D1D|nr:tetratricopeptide repeat protein [Nodosilinea sp. LEGE 07298]MBE9107892.1 tetratricopeptide repeat protein [Nodosilinea sp. LEGE 07298]